MGAGRPLSPPQFFDNLPLSAEHTMDLIALEEEISDLLTTRPKDGYQAYKAMINQSPAQPMINLLAQLAAKYNRKRLFGLVQHRMLTADAYALVQRYNRASWFRYVWNSHMDWCDPTEEFLIALADPTCSLIEYDKLLHNHYYSACSDYKRRMRQLIIKNHHRATWLWRPAKYSYSNNLHDEVLSELGCTRAPYRMLLLFHMMSLGRTHYRSRGLTALFQRIISLPYELQLTIIEFYSGRRIKGSYKFVELDWLNHERLKQLCDELQKTA